MNVYSAADKAIKLMNRKNLRAFNHLKLAKWDEANIIREVGTVYDTSAKDARKRYLEIAIDAYIAAMLSAGQNGKKAKRKAMDDITDDWILAMLEESDPVTLYAFLPEKDRKKERLIEALAAAQNRNLEIDKALRYWTLQVGQYAINAVDRARMEAFFDAGVENVMWNAEKDEKTCEICRERDGKVYAIEDVPSKPHLNCRCWYSPVLD